MSQKELQRVTVISRCVQGNLTCARAAELLDLSPRHVKRLKSRYRQGSAAALAHVSRGRPSHRRTPQATRNRILALARTRYAGFNDHHLHEKLVEKEGFSLSRETLRRLLRANGIGSPRKRRPPAHRQRRLRSAREGELVQLDGSPHDWLEGRGPLLTALGMQDDASGKILAAQFFPSETSEGYFRLLQSLLRRYRRPRRLLRRSQRHLHPQRRSLVARRTTRRPAPAHSVRPRSPATRRHLHRRAKLPRPKAASNASGACCKTASPANSAWRKLAISTRPIASCARFVADYNRRFARTPREAEKAWRPAPQNLERICCFTHERIVSNDNVVQWDGRRLQIHPQPRRFSFAGAKVQIHQALNGRVSLYYRDTRLEHSNLAGG